jgi:hypothetical protein
MQTPSSCDCSLLYVLCGVALFGFVVFRAVFPQPGRPLLVRNRRIDYSYGACSKWECV